MVRKTGKNKPKNKPNRRKPASRKTLKQQEEVFIKVENPVLARKGLLESAKEIVGSKLIIDELKEVRKEKTRTTKELKKIVNQIYSNITQLKKELPYDSIKNLEVKLEIEKPKITPKKTIQKVVEEKKPTFVKKSKMEMELDEINSRLNSL